MQHLIGRIIFLIRGKSDKCHLIGCRFLRLACEPNLFCAFSVGKSQYIHNKSQFLYNKYIIIIYKVLNAVVAEQSIQKLKNQRRRIDSRQTDLV